MALVPYGRRLLVTILDETAKLTPDKPIASVPRTSDLIDGWRDISFRELAHAVDDLAWWLHETIGASTDFETVVYMGINDIRYTIFILAAIKVGLKSLLPSPRNQDEDTIHLIKQTKCTKFFYSAGLGEKGNALKVGTPELDLYCIPSYEDLISGDEKPYTYGKTWQTAKHDPIIALQTSGTTGPPKAVILTNEFIATLDNHHHLVAPLGREKFTIDSVTGRYYSMFPTFHMSGLMSRFLIPLLSDATLIMGPPTLIPNSSLTAQMVLSAGVRKLFIAPSIIEQLAHDPATFSCLSSVDWICTGGGPTAKTAGDKVTQTTTLFNIFGQTETGFPPILLPRREDWAYLEFFPGTGSEFDKIEDGLHELVVQKDSEGACPYQTPFLLFPGMEQYRTKDLFAPHPSRENVWSFVGRADDIIALSNGEKFNPIPMEVVIQGHPLLMGALVTGQGKFQSALLVEPKSGVEAEDVVEEIWGTVEVANSKVKKAARIGRDMILVTHTEKPFDRSAKGAVIRRHTISQYAEELTALYLRRRSSNGPKLEIPNSLSSIGSFVKACIKQVETSKDIDDDADFFVMGMDSLAVLDIAFKVRNGLENLDVTTSPLGQVKTSPSATITRMMYANPTITKFSGALYGFIHSPSKAMDAPGNGAGKPLDLLVQKYTKDWPGRATWALPQDSMKGVGRTFLLTGSTGSLGACLLSKLLLDPTTTKVYCLNRSDTAFSHHQSNFKKRNLPLSLLQTKAVFLQADFGQEGFGLSKADLASLREVDTIIHNAWQVDFNLTLESFEAVHIRGVRNMINFSITHPLLPRIYFTSSISVAMLWKQHHGSTPIPESVLEGGTEAMPQGYAQSKQIAERILAIAAKETVVPVTILRIGQIAGSTLESDPAWKEAEMIPSLIRTSRSLGKVPRTLGARDEVNWMPIDRLIDGIHEIVFRDNEQAGKDFEVFNLVNPQPTSWAALHPVIRRGMEKLEVVDYADWVELLKTCDPDDAEVLKERPAVKLLAFFENFEQGEPDSFQMEATIAASRTMAEMEAVSPALMEVWMKQWGF